MAVVLTRRDGTHSIVLAYFQRPLARSAGDYRYCGTRARKLVGRFAEPLHSDSRNPENTHRFSFSVWRIPFSGSLEPSAS